MTIEPGTITVGSIFLLLVGGYVGHLLTIVRGKHLAKHNAAIDFKKVLNPTIMKLKNGENPLIVINGSFHQQIEAAKIYSAYLNERELNKYRIVINEYMEWFRIVCNRSKEEKFYGENDPKYIEAKSIEPIIFINKLLKYANT